MDAWNDSAQELPEEPKPQINLDVAKELLNQKYEQKQMLDEEIEILEFIINHPEVVEEMNEVLAK